MSFSNDFDGQAASFSTGTSSLIYGQTNFNCGNGSVRFWFQPNWSSDGTYTPEAGTFVQLGGGAQGYNPGEGWTLAFGNKGTVLNGA
jgi:hypothetical protein